MLCNKKHSAYLFLLFFRAVDLRINALVKFFASLSGEYMHLHI